MKETSTHIYFWNGYMSNWAKSPFKINGVTYNCGEQFMMHRKALSCGDEVRARLIMETPDPSRQKWLGRMVENYDDGLWSSIRFDVMVEGLLQKFLQNSTMKQKLLQTGNKVLVEASPVDCIWGVGLLEDDPAILDESNWRGQNLLGKVLMEVRKLINEMP